ncbi:hypothetical protein LJC12_06015 [Odoribacter sp. OttesenSCG-928-J03]|nr:hypothetical protein [Odoribacter sp. OttesenSCG-928-J03]
MDARILAEAKKDIPLYFNDFKAYWDSAILNINDADLTVCYHATLIYKNWKQCLNHVNILTMDVFLSELHEDINTSFFQSYFGLYRTAYMHLRSIIELSMQMVYFYQHEIEYSQWKDGEFVIKHDILNNYLKKHPNFIGQSAFIDELTRSWKKYSKHIHAETPSFFQSSKTAHVTKTFSVADFGEWKANFIKTTYLTNKLFLILFKEKISIFPSVEKSILLKNIKPDDYAIIGVTP